MGEFRMSLFSPLLQGGAGAADKNRCRIKGLSAKSRVNYQDDPHYFLSQLHQFMTTHLIAKSSVAVATLAALSGVWMTTPAWGQSYPVTAGQRATANQVAARGVPLSELAANAPDTYTIKRGDTLWAISRMYLKSPWRWPELWGMNLSEIKNPHLIYPGQRLILERKNGLATLRVDGADTPGEAPIETVRVSPNNRYEALANSALPTLKSSVIEPFLVEPIVATDAELKAAPRIVAGPEEHIELGHGDRVYARGTSESPLLDNQPQEQVFSVYGAATPLKDPGTGEILGYEAAYAGKAVLVRGESTTTIAKKEGEKNSDMVPAIVPATLDIVDSKDAIHVGDRLFPVPPRALQTYTPHAPEGVIAGRVVSAYGDAVANAGQNQVVSINLGKNNGMEVGHVLAIMKDGVRATDNGDSKLPLMKLPDERNGLLMVFRVFDRVSYALTLETTDGVRVGDRLVNPR